MTNLRIVALLFSLLLSGCVGGNLSSKDDAEMYPLRPATTKENSRLKRCLRAAQKAQIENHKKTKKLIKKASDLGVDDTCQGLHVKIGGTPTGYEIRAELRDDETTVRWSINEKSVIEEHLDSNVGDEDLEF